MANGEPEGKGPGCEHCYHLGWIWCERARVACPACGQKDPRVKPGEDEIKEAAAMAMSDTEYRLLIRAIVDLGFIYVLRDDGVGDVKIGHTFNLHKRLGDLATGNSRRLRIVTVFIGGRKHERVLHAQFADRRRRGEWFDDRDLEVTETVLVLAGGNFGRGTSWKIE